MTSPIDPELSRSFEDASAALIERLRDAIKDFRASSPDAQRAWELRSDPTDWETRVLSNLEEYHRNLQGALREHRGGDIRRITREAGSYAGLSRDLNGYQMDWMTEHNRVAVEQAMEQVMSVADRIHRLGYRALKELGQV